MKIPHAELVDQDRSASTLTNTQRDFLTGENSPAHERQFRNRMRDRIRDGLIDGVYFQHIGENGRKNIFEPLNDGHGDQQSLIDAHTQRGEKDNWDGLRELDPEKLRLTQEIQMGARSWLGFLYAAITDASPVITQTDAVTLPTEEDIERAEESYGEGVVREYFPEKYTNPQPRIHFHFETMLREAVEQVAEQRGERVTNFELTIETEPVETSSDDPDIDELERRYENGDRSLTMDQLHTLRRNTDITGEDLQNWLQETME